jgi:hypothetical protein
VHHAIDEQHWNLFVVFVRKFVVNQNVAMFDHDFGTGVSCAKAEKHSI